MCIKYNVIRSRYFKNNYYFTKKNFKYFKNILDNQFEVTAFHFLFQCKKTSKNQQIKQIPGQKHP